MATIESKLLSNQISVETLGQVKKTTKNDQTYLKAIMCLFIVICLILLSLVFKIAVKYGWSDETTQLKSYPEAVNLFFNRCFFVVFGIQVTGYVIASFDLLRSTKNDAQIKVALMVTKIWRNVTLINLVLDFLNAALTVQFSFVWSIFSSFQVCMIVVVQSYIDEFEWFNLFGKAKGI